MADEAVEQSLAQLELALVGLGRMNELQNALTFALEANVSLSANPSLQAIA